MTSKVTAKLRLGAASCMLLVALALLASCQQGPSLPGFTVATGMLSDTTWKSPDGSRSIKFGSDGSVSLDGVNLKELGILWYGLGNIEVINTINGGEWRDLAYSWSGNKAIITGRLANEGVNGTKDHRYDLATLALGVMEGTPQKTNYYAATVKFNTAADNAPTSTGTKYTMEVPKKDSFQGTWHDLTGRKALEVNSDGTFVTFSNGGKTVQFWKDGGGDGTILVYSSRQQMEATGITATPGTSYYCYPHCLTLDPGAGGSSSAYWK